MITVPKKLQEVFDIVSNHLLTQMKRSSVSFQTPDRHNHENCMYLNPDGLKCAAGALIPNDQYSPDFEGQAWESLADNGFVERIHLIPIAELQNIHDWIKPEDWKFELVAFAKQYNLSHSIIV